MDEILKIVVPALLSGAAGHYWGIRKYKKEKTWEVKCDFYTKAQQCLDCAEVALDVNKCSGGACDLDDYDRIYGCIYDIRAIVAAGRSFLKPDVLKCVEDLIKSLDDGMIWYRESFGDGDPFDAVVHMKDATVKAKGILADFGRKDLAA